MKDNGLFSVVCNPIPPLENRANHRNVSLIRLFALFQNLSKMFAKAIASRSASSFSTFGEKCLDFGNLFSSEYVSTYYLCGAAKS